ncbi:MAG: Stp1/IreP family PP2C-type Ser/Thr phosphatase [Anaerolineae bacterium]|jgi:serine/threonine protein phosphatase PrpC
MQFLKRLLRLEQTESDTEPPASKEAVQPQSRLRVGWATDVGRVRTHNEDTALVITAAHDGDGAMPKVGLFVLADGMGGHQSGEVASSLAARAVAHYITHEFYLPALLGQEPDTNQPALRDVLIDAVRAANEIVAERVPGGGTTLTCALMLDLRAYIAHVGDSRAYIVTTEGKLDQITHDHSLVDRLVELGQLTPDEAAIHPQKNVLYRAVGQGGDLEVDTYMRTVSAGEKLLLCSDGLWGIVDEAKMAKIIASSSSLQAACENLVVAANQAGGRDNITVILAEPPAG